MLIKTMPVAIASRPAAARRTMLVIPHLSYARAVPTTTVELLPANVSDSWRWTRWIWVGVAGVEPGHETSDEGFGLRPGGEMEGLLGLHVHDLTAWLPGRGIAPQAHHKRIPLDGGRVQGQATLRMIQMGAFSLKPTGRCFQKRFY